MKAVIERYNKIKRRKSSTAESTLRSSGNLYTFYSFNLKAESCSTSKFSMESNFMEQFDLIRAAVIINRFNRECSRFIQRSRLISRETIMHRFNN